MPIKYINGSYVKLHGPSLSSDFPYLKASVDKKTYRQLIVTHATYSNSMMLHQRAKACVFAVPPLYWPVNSVGTSLNTLQQPPL